jgi:hypothetical protein
MIRALYLLITGSRVIVSATKLGGLESDHESRGQKVCAPALLRKLLIQDSQHGQEGVGLGRAAKHRLARDEGGRKEKHGKKSVATEDVADRELEILDVDGL